MSLTIQGLIVMILGKFLSWSGIPYVSEDLTTSVTTIVMIIGAAMSYWGRYRQGTITWWGGKK